MVLVVDVKAHRQLATLLKRHCAGRRARRGPLANPLQLNADEGPPARVPVPLSDSRAGAHRRSADVHERVEQLVERGGLALIAVQDEHEVLRFQRVREVEESGEVLPDVGNTGCSLLRYGVRAVRVVGA